MSTPMSFQVKEAKNQLENYSLVYTLRLKKRIHEGNCWYNYKRGEKKQGDIFVEFIKEIENDNELKPYLKDSGFKTVEDWRFEAKKSTYLCKVELMNKNEPIENDQKSFRSQILALLKQNELTSKEIQNELGGDNKLIQVYLNEFKNEKKIQKIGNKGKFFIWKAIEPKKDKNSFKLLKDLYDLMSNKMNFEKTPDTSDIKLIKTIKEMV